MTRALTLMLALAAGASVAGCDGTDGDTFERLLVVSASLGEGEPLPQVLLSSTSPLLDRFDPETVAVSGARVTVTLLGPDGADQDRVPYVGAEPGRYVPASGTPPVVLAGRSYRLDVEAEGQTVRAVTTVPPAVALVQGPSDRVVYGVGQGPEIRIRQTSTPERQAAFVASTRALAAADFAEVTVDGEARYRSVPDPDRFLPVPVYQRFLDCEPEATGTILCGEDPRQNALVGTSPVINEDGYIDLGGGVALVQVPFIAFGFYGPYRISLVSVDAALQAFVQTQAIQGGGTTLSPGEIPNVTTNVRGRAGRVRVVLARPGRDDHRRPLAAVRRRPELGGAATSAVR